MSEGEHEKLQIANISSAMHTKTERRKLLTALCESDDGFENDELFSFGTCACVWVGVYGEIEFVRFTGALVYENEPKQ